MVGIGHLGGCNHICIQRAGSVCVRREVAEVGGGQTGLHNRISREFVSAYRIIRKLGVANRLIRQHNLGIS
jgi:hypothetical protein